MKYYYIHKKEDNDFIASVVAYAKSKGVELLSSDIKKLDALSVEGNEHILVTAPIDELKKVMHFASERGLSLGIIPRAEQKELKSTFDFPNELEARVDLALTPCDKKLDLLYCNDNLVLQEVVIGEVPPLDSFSSSMEKLSFWERTKSFFSTIKKINALTHTAFTVTTAKEKVLKFSAIGSVGVEYNNRTFASKLITNYLKFNDSRLSLVVLSPSSILEYVGYLFQSHILNQTPKSLPQSVGYVHSHSLYIEAGRELSVTIDSVNSLHTPVKLETKAEATAIFISWLLPLSQLTSEMNGRLSPTILDMLVAIVSGVAAAYAKSNEKIIGSLAGVAIAVALVPPLAVSGIGLGWGEWHMFSSALLLFITNLVGIVLAASLTFLMLGFSPVAVAKKGIFGALVLVAIVSVPLYISFTKMKYDIDIQQQLSAFETSIGSKNIHLKNIDLQGKEVRCEVIASDILSKEEKEQLKVLIAQEVGEEVKVLASFWYEL